MRLSFRVFLGYVAIILPVILAAWVMGIPATQIAILTVIATIAALIASSILMVLLERPIQELQRGAQRIAEGKFTPIQLEQAPSGLEALAGSFNQMVESLRSRDNQLQALNDELSRRLRELNALYEVSRSVNSSLDIQEVLRAILNETVKTFPTANKGLIHLIDESGKRLIPIALSDTSRPLDPSMGMPIDQGIAGRVVRTRKPVTLSDTAQDPDFIDLGSNVRSLMVVPLMVGDNVIGALSLDSHTRNSFTSDMEEVFQSLANRAVIALENARLYSESQKRVKELTSLYNSALSLSSEQSPESLHEQLVQRATELLDANSGILFITDQTHRELKVVSSLNMADNKIQPVVRFGEGLAGQVAQTSEPQIVNATTVEGEAANGSSEHEVEGSVVAVPLIWENEVLGVLQIARRPTQPSFEAADARLLTLFAQQGASALENARLLSNQRRRTRQLALLNDLNRRFAAILDADMLMKEAVQGVAERFGYAIVNIGLLEGEWFVMKASSNPEAASLHSGTQRIGEEGIIGHVAATGQPYVANDVLSDPHYLPVFPETQSELAVPILGKDGVLGVLDIQERHHNAFLHNDVSIMQNLAVQLGIALDNAHLFHAAQQRAGQLTKILEVTQDLRRQQELELMLQKITDIVQQTLGWRTVLLAMLDMRSGMSAPVAVATDDEDLRERILLMPPRPASNAHWEEERFRISQSYFVRGEELSYPDGDERLVRSDMGERAPWEWQSDDLLVIPIIGYSGPLGHLSVDDPVDRQRPTLEKIQVLEIFAHQAASAIEDARLIEELHLKTDALEEANKGLSRASQMKSEFLANMSHELRTPLNAILGFSEILVDQAFGPLNDRQIKYVSNINTSGQHLLDLINDILDLSKIEAGRMELMLELFRLQGAINEVYTIIEPLATKKSLVVDINTDGAPERIVADRLRFKQVLYNVISNAVKFTPEEGRIEIRAWEEPDGEHAKLLYITVKDSGIGIPQDQIEQIFDVFHRLDRSYKRETEGTGLGLALVRRFLELHGGDIRAESEVGAGSTFIITLPQTEAMARALQAVGEFG